MSEKARCGFCHGCWNLKLRASLSLKLITIFVVGSVALTILMGALSEFGLQRHFLQTVRPLLGHYLFYLAEEVGSPPDIQKAEALAKQWPLTIRIFNQQQSWASDGRIQEPKIKRRPWLDEAEQAKHELHFYWDHGVVFLQHQDGASRVYFGLKLRPSGLKFPLLFISVLLLGLYVFYRLTRRLFAPIRTIQDGISRIGSGQLQHRIQLKRTDELGQLAQAVNTMADDLETMMQAKRDLLLALSHELKSPLARSRVTLALLDDSPYQQALLEDQATMQQLIDEIIEAERGHSDQSALHSLACYRQWVDIHALVQGVLASFEQKRPIQADICPAGTQADIDPTLIKRLLRNLVENAVRYNREEMGQVTVVCKVTDNELLLKVQDHGEGLEQVHVARLTEAFYRADPSRERKTGGSGLGLYLCQAAVNAHQGKMAIESTQGKGTRVTCHIPLQSEV